MAEQVKLDDVISDIIFGLDNLIEDPQHMNDIKMVLYLVLYKFQIFKEETLPSPELDMTYQNLAEYLLSMELRGCTEKSVEAYKNILKSMLGFVNKNVRYIKYQDLMGYLAYGKKVRKWKDRTYNTKLVAIRNFFQYLYEEDKIDDNPAKKLKETKVEFRIGPTISGFQREELRCACESELEYALCDMLYSTGARISELCGLDRADVNLENMTAIVYGKGRKEREIYFTAPAKVHLERYLESRTDDNPALFVITRNPYSRMSPSVARSILRRIKARDADISAITLTPHVFRRSVATDMINTGAPLELVTEKLGQVKMDTARQHYAALARKTVQQAHERFVG